MATLPQRPATDLALLRLSDAEREQAVALFNEAVADGRLSWQEHAERVELAWGCRTHAELAPYLTDLARAAVATSVPQRVLAVGSKIVRAPEPGRRVQARALFGAVFLTLLDVAAGEELLVEASSFCGKVVLIVGADATVIDEGDAVLGKRKILASAPAGNGPLIRISGRSTLGHLKVLRRGGYWH